MARDLIPPPSPAGRPAPDGKPNLIELPPEEPQAVAVNLNQKTGPSDYRNRFGFLGGGLIGVIVAALAVAGVVIATSGPADEGLAKNWSKWQPQETSLTAGPAEIAEHVGAQYRGDDGKQLVEVTGGPLEIQGVKLGVLLQPSSGNIHPQDGTAVLYNLNGLGAGGSMKNGTPSTQRHQLLRREALELALYTFRYLRNVDMVVTLLPPPPDSSAEDSSSSASSSTSQQQQGPLKPTQQAVFYRPGDLKPQLQVPLGVTVPAKAPTPDTIPSGQAHTIDALTLNNLFQASIQQDQVLGVNMVLDRPKTG